MKNIFAGVFCLIIYFNITIKAQGEAAIPMLSLNPDPQSVALGWGGAANVSSSPSGYYYNPALLGYYAQTNNFSVQTYTAIPNWLEFMGVKLYNNTFTAGYSYKNLLKNFNVSIGLGYMHTKLSYGTFARTGPEGPEVTLFEAADKYDAYSFGINLDYFINLSFGMNIKNVNSVLIGHVNGEESGSGSADVTATDWGLLLNIPVSKLFFNNYSFHQGSLNLKPFVDFSFGMSRVNIGDEIYYIDPAQKDPIPLTTHMGYNISLGTDIDVFDSPVQLFKANLMIDAQDILIDRKDFDFSYQSGFGDINFTENLIKWKPTDKALIRKGASITFFETITLLSGSFFGPGYPGGVHTKGTAVSSDGLFKILSAGTSNSVYKFLASHIEIKYVTATNLFNSDFSSASIILKGFSL